MPPIPRRSFLATLPGAVVAMSVLPRCLSAAETGQLDLASVSRLIKPHPGESHWRQVSWLTSVWEARQKAAAEGKPIFIWAGSGGGPVGIC